MKISELIKALQKIENKEKDIFICHKWWYYLITDISMSWPDNIIVLHYWSGKYDK
jgi:hypothetical protein